MLASKTDSPYCATWVWLQLTHSLLRLSRAGITDLDHDTQAEPCPFEILRGASLCQQDFVNHWSLWSTQPSGPFNHRPLRDWYLFDSQSTMCTHTVVLILGNLRPGVPVRLGNIMKLHLKKTEKLRARPGDTSLRSRHLRVEPGASEIQGLLVHN